VHLASGKEIGIFLLFAGFGLKILPQLNIKAVHNLKIKSMGIILTPSAIFVPVSTILGFSGNMWRRLCSFWHFGPILPQLKNFPKS